MFLVSTLQELQTVVLELLVTIFQIKQMCEALKNNPRFIGQLRRFYTSGIARKPKAQAQPRRSVSLQDSAQYLLGDRDSQLHLLNVSTQTNNVEQKTSAEGFEPPANRTGICCSIH